MENKTDLEKIKGGYRWPHWGRIEIHEIGRYAVVEVENRRTHETEFYAYADGRFTNCYEHTLDAVLLAAIGYAWDGPNSQFAKFAVKMLGVAPEA